MNAPEMLLPYVTLAPAAPSPEAEAVPFNESCFRLLGLDGATILLVNGSREQLLPTGRVLLVAVAPERVFQPAALQPGHLVVGLCHKGYNARVYRVDGVYRGAATDLTYVRLRPCQNA